MVRLRGWSLIGMTSAVLFIGFLFFESASYGLLIPDEGPPDYKGGSTVGFTGEGSATWDNKCGQDICDFRINVSDADDPDEQLDWDAYGVYVKVDNVVKTDDWKSYSADRYHFKADSSAKCPPNKTITVGVDDKDAGDGLEPGDVKIRFTDYLGNDIKEAKEFLNTQAMTLLTLSTSGTYPDDNWSLVVKNTTQYPITGLTLSESPSLTMSDLYTNKPGTTSTSGKTVTFDFPLSPNGGTAIIGANYTSIPTQSTTVTCTPTITEVVAESVNPRQSFVAGTNISVPNVVLEEVVAAAIDDDGVVDEIILEPRNQFEFNSVGAIVLSSGSNISLGTPSISNGKICIPIIGPSYSEGKSKITVTGVTINTLTGLREGTISARQTEPTGNCSNFNLAYFEPE